MGMSYTDSCCLFSGKVSGLGATSVDLARFTNKNYSFLVKSVSIVIGTAGAQATSSFILEVNGGSPNLVTYNMGTAAANTVHQADVIEANREQVASTIIVAKHTSSSSDGTIVYYFTVWGTLLNE